MRFQDHTVRTTHKALEDLLRSAAAIPPDRLDWSPNETSRSTLSQLQEIAAGARWILAIVRDRRMPEFDDHARRESDRLRQTYDTLERCRDAARATTDELLAEVAAFPDDHLEDEIALPFGGGTILTMAEILQLHYWNVVYHLGQINYIQTILGDREMH
ncbi:MAG TPA: DinB family protein [Fimbriimonadaceae bacterium]|nr:DinB family protein [Fimbriimonadaceae bacterium]